MRNKVIDELVGSCRVPESVKPQKVGPWEIRRFGWPDGSGNPFAEAMLKMRMNEAGLAPFADYTALLRPTPSDAIGDVVMEDSPRELRKHLPILIEGKGRILVTGLGLGCVVRGLLSKPDVTHIDVIESDADVIELMWSELVRWPTDRVTLVHGDALTLKWAFGTSWDYAWHDIWTPRGDDHLQVAHGQLIVKYDRFCPVQGAWNFPRPAKRKYGQLRPILGSKRITQREYEALMFGNFPMPERPRREANIPSRATSSRVKFVRDFTDPRHAD